MLPQPTLYRDVYLLDVPTLRWNTMPGMRGTPPPARFGHVAHPVNNGKQMLIFGGSDGYAALPTTHLFDVRTNTWWADFGMKMLLV